MNLGTLFKLAFRNVWRNKRRTLITGASVMFAVFFASLMESVQQGAWDNMVHNIVGFHTGYLQVHKQGYWEDQTLDNSMLLADVQESLKASNVEMFPRVENFALVSHKNKTKGALVVGTDPVQETELTGLNERLVDGHYLRDSMDVLVASGLAEYLGISVGDSLVLLSQGRHGANAAGLYYVAGLVRFGSPELNNQICYLGLSNAQTLFNMEGMASSLVANLDSEEDLELITAQLRTTLGDEYEVMDYKQLLPDIMQAKEFDDLSGRIIILILYLLIGFGIFATLLMMLKERNFEFGVLKAIGFKSPHLYTVVWMEVVLIALGGVLAGIVLVSPLMWYFSEHPIVFTGEYAEVYENFGMEPILPFKLDLTIMLAQASIVFILTTVMSIYAFFKIKGLKSVKAMRA